MDHAHVIDYRKVELHRNDVVVLRNINLTVDAGELLYLTGKVGSGKSTFLKSLYSEIPIAAGQASCLGHDLVTIRRKQIPLLRREVGIVFQDFRLLNDRSVFDNLMFVPKATGWKDNAAQQPSAASRRRAHGQPRPHHRISDNEHAQRCRKGRLDRHHRHTQHGPR